MDSQKQQVSERIKQANNILVTVSSNPSVDQLSACIGLTIALNKMGKHATAVFSGGVPSTIEFLQPEKTIEKNTDSLRDFIIALDKSKADKLRYKVEDKVVKIFITPYKTSISDKDLQFSQGDFNVDVVVALGVHDQTDLDQAITAHGRILHDATVMSVNIRPGGELGSINWVDPGASSLAELATQLVDILDKKLIDNQIATALLTGIVAETDRFSNAKTSPQTMSISAELMAAGANQQLVATKLQEPAPAPAPAPMALTPAAQEAPEDEKKPNDGTLEITHDDRDRQQAAADSEKSEPPKEEAREETKEEAPAKPEPKPEPAPKPEPKPEIETPQIHIDEHGSLGPAQQKTEQAEQKESPKPSHRHDDSPHLVLQPPTFSSQFAAGTTPTGFPSEDAMTLPAVESDGPLLNREPLQTPSVAHTIAPPERHTPPDTAAPTTLPELSDLPSLPAQDKPTQNAPTFTPMPPEPSSAPSPVTVTPPPAGPPATLSDIERDVHSTHIDEAQLPTPTPPPAPSHHGQPVLPQTDPNASPNDMVDPSTPPLGAAPDQQNTDLNSARDAVNQAIGSGNSPLDPIEALNAQSLGGPLHNTGVQPPAVDNGNPLANLPGVSNASFSPEPTPSPSTPPSFGMPAPTMPPQNPGAAMPGPGTPPPVPPPMLPPVPPAQ